VICITMVVMMKRAVVTAGHVSQCIRVRVRYIFTYGCGVCSLSAMSPRMIT